MNKIFTLTSAFALALTSTMATPQVANAQGKSDAAKAQRDACYALIAGGDYPGLNLGECLSFDNAAWPGFKAHVCDFFRETGLLDDYEFDSYSDCIRNF